MINFSNRIKSGEGAEEEMSTIEEILSVEIGAFDTLCKIVGIFPEPKLTFKGLHHQQLSKAIETHIRKLSFVTICENIFLM